MDSDLMVSFLKMFSVWLGEQAQENQELIEDSFGMTELGELFDEASEALFDLADELSTRD